MSNKVNIQQYIEDFNERAYGLSKVKLEVAPPADERVITADQMIEDYMAVVGKQPQAVALHNLGSYIIVGDLKNKDVDKVTNNEYPVLSDVQIKRRDRKQMSMETDTMDFLNSKYNREMDSLAKTPVRKQDD